MIYVVVRESGSYSDYTKDLVFASTSKEIAEKKKQEVERIAKIAQDIETKVEQFKVEYQKQNPSPLYPDAREQSLAGIAWNGMAWENSAIKEYYDKRGEYNLKVYELGEAKRDELISQSEISAEDAKNYCYGGEHYSVEEVESDKETYE